MTSRNPLGDARSPAPAHALDRTDDPPTPAEILFGVQITDQSRGRVVATCNPPRFTGTAVLPVGAFGTLADTTTGRSVRTLLPPTRTLRTVDFRLDAGPHLVVPGDMITAEGRVEHVSNGHALATATLSASDGRVVARCTARFVVVDRVGDEPPPIPPVVARLRRQAHDLEDLLGVEEILCEPDRVSLRVLPGRSLGNHYAMTHGGVQLALSDVALRRVVGTEGSAELLDLTVSYFRPVPIDGTDVTLEATVCKRGALITVAEQSALDRSGRVLFRATGTFASGG